MRRASLLLAVLVAAGCGGAANRQLQPADQAALDADGMSVVLPDGWSGRILIGDSGRAVLHASTLPLEANDTDTGQIAKEALGVNGMYLNVRDLGPGEADGTLPVHFDASDFGSTPFEGGLKRQAAADVASDGERFAVTAVSGGDSAPPQRYLDQLNEALSSLSLGAYAPQTVEPATGNAIAGFGLEANVPDGWQGGIGRGEVHAGDGTLDLQISEFGSTDAGAGNFVTGHLPIQIGPDEFVRPQGGTGYETGRTFLDAGRDFQLWVRSPDAHPDAHSLDRANAFLASFRAQPGDFYPGQVDPATFQAADGWDTGSTGAADIQPDGQQTMSWASTGPYRDSGFQFPPSKTLEALPPDGVVLIVQLQQEGREGGPPVQPPFRLADFQAGDFEGLGTENGPRTFGGRYSDYNLTIWALFGREHPTQEQLDRAQAELDRLDLPTWPAWTTGAAR